MTNKQNRPVPLRRAGAPRLIEWTGERCVPWTDDIQVVYEHFHRYLWARELVSGSAVLDLGSGEGFGSAILFDSAATVVGLDIDEDSVTHAELNWAGDGLSFVQGSATDLSRFDNATFGFVVAFEVVEHVSDQATMLAEIRRVLKPDGILLTSTPDRNVYSAENPAPNPFHEKELSRREFEVLLGEQFSNIRLFSQRTIEGSRIDSLQRSSTKAAEPLQVELREGEWQVAGPPAPRFLIAIASSAALPDIPDSSTLADFDLQLMRRFEAIVGEERNKAIKARGVAEDRQRQLEEVHLQLRDQQELIEGLTNELEGEKARAVDSSRGALEELTEKAALSARRAVVAEQAADRSIQELTDYQSSIGWRFFRRLRNSVFNALGGEDSRPSRLAKETLRIAHKFFGNSSPAHHQGRRGEQRGGDETAFDLPTSGNPVASIIIPVYDGPEITRQCLLSILYSIDDVPYEVIVVDDCADEATKAVIDSVGGVNVIRNVANQGFLRSANRGAAAANGKFVVFLNNDTEPQPGWLKALINRAERDHSVGAVVAQLLYGDAPDHTLQEAGGIVWSDGTAWNFGNGGNASSAEYAFTREVDYGSAAALLVRTSAWREVGGFDLRFSPAYWEDVDLCFALRAAGWKVVYEPSAKVIHHEGGSMGTEADDPRGKQYQSINQARFIEKWSDALSAHPSTPGPERAALASNWRRSPTVLIVDHDLPRQDRDAGSLRMLGIIQNFVDLGWRVVFVPDNGSNDEPYATNLRDIGVCVLNGGITLREHIAALAPDIRLAVLSRPYVAPRYLHEIREQLPNALLAYDTVDLHFVRERGRALHSPVNSEVIDVVADGFEELEGALCRASDVTLVVSPTEIAAVSALTDKPVYEVGLANKIWATVPGAEARKGLLFVGNFAHPPNVDAAINLVSHIMPAVWRLDPSIGVTIAGHGPPASLLALQTPKVEVTGWIEDLAPILASSRVLVAPLRFGAGLKGKISEALGAGLPVVTTSVGAGGFPDGEGLYIADDEGAMAAGVVSLHQDDDLWAEASVGAQEIAMQATSIEAQRRQILALIGGLTGAHATNLTSFDIDSSGT